MAAVLASGAAVAAPAGGPRIPREELEGIQAAVEAAVIRVSRPAGLMFGRPSRAYHLKGYGAVVVLAPRALPRARRPAEAGPDARAFADLVARLEHMPHPRLAVPPPDIESLQEEAEAFRREAERAMEKAERDVLIRLRVTEDGRTFAFSAPTGVPEPPEPPDPPEAPDPGVPPTQTVPAVPPAPPIAFLPPPPFWFGEADAAAAPPDRVLADVRRAIVAGLGAYRGGLALIAPDEFVVVAVDFVPRMMDRAPARTVVARARKRDLVDHRAGRLSADALHARVEFDEY
jgi:hypothetical protein